jgi:uncharacterized protein YegP (UPF0339 family)
MPEAKLHIYKRTSLIPKRRGWAWRLVHQNGQILANDGGQGYSRREDAEEIGRKVTAGSYALEVVFDS